MIKQNYFPNLTFNNEKEFFHKLKDYELEIIDFKKSQIYKGKDKGIAVPFVFNAKESGVKNLSFAKDNFIYPLISSTKFMDSHDDVHFDGCFNKTAKEQQGRVFFVDTHGRKMSDIISAKSKIKMLVQNVDWEYLGKNYDGQSEVLAFEIAKADVRPDALKLMEEERDLECSISMQYVKMFLGVNSKDPAFKENLEYFENRIKDIANSDKALNQNYFFGVEELKIVNEGSLCPITGGSNSATRVYQNNIEAVNDTSTKEAEKSLQLEETQKEQLKQLLSKFK